MDGLVCACDTQLDQLVWCLVLHPIPFPLLHLFWLWCGFDYFESAELHLLFSSHILTLSYVRWCSCNMISYDGGS